MKTWEERFFALNRTNEVELVGISFEHLFRALAALDWSLDDEFWAPDLQVSRFLRQEEEIFVIQETYFDPKLAGTDLQVEELSDFISKISPDEFLCAGARPSDGTNQAEQVVAPNRSLPPSLNSTSSVRGSEDF